MPASRFWITLLKLSVPTKIAKLLLCCSGDKKLSQLSCSRASFVCALSLKTMITSKYSSHGFVLSLRFHLVLSLSTMSIMLFRGLFWSCWTCLVFCWVSVVECRARLVNECGAINFFPSPHYSGYNQRFQCALVSGVIQFDPSVLLCVHFCLLSWVHFEFFW
jgi:hypothetical protein